MRKSLSKKVNIRNAYFYIPVIIVCIIFCIAISIVIAAFQQEDKVRNDKSLAYIVNNLDNTLVNTENAAAVFLNSSNSIRLSKYNASEMDDEYKDIAYELSADIAKFCDSNRLTKDVLCYFPKTDCVVGKKGCLSSYKYYKSLYPKRDSSEGYEIWKACISVSKGPDSFLYSDSDTSAPDFYHYRSNPQNRYSNCDRSIAVIVNKDAIKSAIVDVSGISAISRLDMITEDGRVFFSYSKGNEQDNNLVSTRHSMVWKMEFNSSFELPQAYRFVIYIQVVLIVLACVAFILGFGTTLFLEKSKRKRVISLLQEYVPSINGNKNHYELLCNAIEKLYDKNEHQIWQIEQQARYLSSAFLRECIYQGLTETERVEALGEIYGIILDKENFKLIIQTTNVKENDGRTAEIWLNGTNDDNMRLCNAEIENLDLILLNWDDKEIEIDELLKKTDLSQCIVSDVFHSSGEIFNQFSYIYKKINGKTFLEGLSSEKVNNVAKKFVNLIKSYRISEACQLLPDIQIWAASVNGENEKECEKYAVLNDLYATSYFSSKKAVLDRLFEDKNGQNWESILTCGLEKGLETQSVKKENFPEVAMKIIKEEYYNPQLSLGEISDRIGISQSYLSKIFKEKYGEGFSVVLSKVRINRAKELMHDESMSIKDIAVKVGFYNDMNFIRVFKKLEDNTPGSYRKGHIEEK